MRLVWGGRNEVDVEQTTKAVNALLAHHEKKQGGRASQALLGEDEERIHLQVTLLPPPAMLSPLSLDSFTPHACTYRAHTVDVTRPITRSDVTDHTHEDSGATVAETHPHRTSSPAAGHGGL